MELFPVSFSGEIKLDDVGTSECAAVLASIARVLHFRGASVVERTGSSIDFTCRQFGYDTYYGPLRAVDRGRITVVEGSPGVILYRVWCLRTTVVATIVLPVLVYSVSMFGVGIVAALAASLAIWIVLVAGTYVDARMRFAPMIRYELPVAALPDRHAEKNATQ